MYPVKMMHGKREIKGHFLSVQCTPKSIVPFFLMACNLLRPSLFTANVLEKWTIFVGQNKLGKATNLFLLKQLLTVHMV